MTHEGWKQNYVQYHLYKMIPKLEEKDVLELLSFRLYSILWVSVFYSISETSSKQYEFSRVLEGSLRKANLPHLPNPASLSALMWLSLC